MRSAGRRVVAVQVWAGMPIGAVMPESTPSAAVPRPSSSGAPSLDAGLEVAEVLDALAASLVAARAIVEVASLPRLDADPAAFRTVVRELLRQALACRGGMPPRLRVTAEPCGADVCVAVTDNGLAPDARPGRGRAPEAVRAAVARMGGDVWTEPAPDGGTAVLFTVRAAA